MSKNDALREPLMGEYDGQKQFNCQWPGCEFDTFDEAAWRDHIDPVTGRHPEPIGRPGLNTPLSTNERAELDAFRAAKDAAEQAAMRAAKDATAPGADAKKGG